MSVYYTVLAHLPPNHLSLNYPSLLAHIIMYLQFTIQLRLKPLLTLDSATDHRHNHELTARLSANRHGCIDGDADGKGGLEGGET
jgi:hypothetical protein